MRSFERLRVHYELEKHLAQKLRRANARERPVLYAQLYDQLFREITDHPQAISKSCTKDRISAVTQQLRLVRRFIKKEDVFIEIGAGDCLFSCTVASQVKQVYAIEVSPEITNGVCLPENATLVFSNGIDISLQEKTVNVAYSHQLMEHLHPEDAYAQLQEIYRVLKPGGAYICVTPNSLSGPHDISRYFDDEATGFHLKEYAVSELFILFRTAGFSRCFFYAGGKGLYVRVPFFLVCASERLLLRMPVWLRKKLARSFLGRAFLGITIVARK